MQQRLLLQDIFELFLIDAQAQRFTASTLRTVLLTCKYDRDRALVALLIDSTRTSESVKLNVGDVNLRNGQVSVKMGKDQKNRTTFIGPIGY